jgi:pyruvate,water dikinase
VVAHEPPATTDAADGADAIVLVARSVDAGWAPALGRVAAVAAAIGGDLSHGSIIVRELGLPAVTNLGESVMALADGDRVELDADRGTLRRLGP